MRRSNNRDECWEVKDNKGMFVGLSYLIFRLTMIV